MALSRRRRRPRRRKDTPDGERVHGIERSAGGDRADDPDCARNGGKRDTQRRKREAIPTLELGDTRSLLGIGEYRPQTEERQGPADREQQTEQERRPRKRIEGFVRTELPVTPNANKSAPAIPAGGRGATNRRGWEVETSNHHSLEGIGGADRFRLNRAA